jgi:hypothetical protein
MQPDNIDVRTFSSRDITSSWSSGKALLSFNRIDYNCRRTVCVVMEV